MNTADEDLTAWKDDEDDDGICCLACGKEVSGGGFYCSSKCEEIGNPSSEDL